MKLLVEKYFLLFIGIILCFAFFTRIYRVGDIHSYIFDEVYHAVTAKLIRENDSRAFEWWNPPPEPDTAVDWLHPPLAKYTQALGMMAFDETPFGWRISSVVFGTLVVAAIALLAHELFHDKRITVLAAFLASFDGLLLVQSRIAMNDIHVTFFILISFIFYLKYRTATVKNTHDVQPKSIEIPGFTLLKKSDHTSHVFFLFLTGMSLGLAISSKWSALFAVVAVIFFENISLLQRLKVYVEFYQDEQFLATRLSSSSNDSYIGRVFQITRKPEFFWKTLKTIFSQMSKVLIYLIVIPGIVYVMSYWQMFAQGKSFVCEQDFVQENTCYCSQTSSWWVDGLKTIIPQKTATWEALEARGGCKRLISHFSELHNQIWWYQTNLEATHPFQSRPLQWFLDSRPVWMYVSYQEDAISNIYAQGNPALFWFGDIAVIITIFVLLFSYLRNDTFSEPAIRQDKIPSRLDYLPSLPPLTFLLITYFLMWLPWQASPRIMFFYHYTPAVPLLSILLAYWLVKVQDSNPSLRLGSHDLRLSRILLFSTLIAIVITFCLFYPNWTGMSVPNWYANAVYFFLPSWK